MGAEQSERGLGEIRVQNGRVERWNGQAWEPITGPQPHYNQPDGGGSTER